MLAERLKAHAKPDDPSELSMGGGGIIWLLSAPGDMQASAQMA